VNTVGRHGDENTIQHYVKSQGAEKEYKRLHHRKPPVKYILYKFIQAYSFVIKVR
jgi:hypothetical protein